MTNPKSNLSVVSADSPQPKVVSADEFAAGFMKFATSLVDFENNHQDTPVAERKRTVRVVSLSSLRVQAPVQQQSDVDEASSNKVAQEPAAVMPFRRATDSKSDKE